MALNILGTGTTYAGRSDERDDGTFVATEWLVILYMPVVPLYSDQMRALLVEKMFVLVIPLTKETPQGTIQRMPTDRRLRPTYWSDLLSSFKLTVGLILALAICMAGFAIISHFAEGMVALGLIMLWIVAIVAVPLYLGKRSNDRAEPPRLPDRKL